MLPVILESPFDGPNPAIIGRNKGYARMAARDSICNHLEAPFISHLLYTQEWLLDDKIISERLTGMIAAREWYRFAKRIVVYEDFGISLGMEEGIRLGRELGLPIFRRTIL